MKDEKDKLEKDEVFEETTNEEVKAQDTNDENVEQETEAKKVKKEKTWKRIILEDLAVVLVAIAIGLCIRYFAMPVKVIGHSMEQTLQNGDYMLMDRMSYRNSNPQYGDVVVTNSGLENGQKKLIKRVIGLPGDKIVVKDGHVFRNGKMSNESYIKEEMLPTEFVTDVVPEGQVFVMGDNRNDSLDSRSPSVGTLSVKQDLIGKWSVLTLNNKSE